MVACGLCGKGIACCGGGMVVAYSRDGIIISSQTGHPIATIKTGSLGGQSGLLGTPKDEYPSEYCAFKGLK